MLPTLSPLEPASLVGPLDPKATEDDLRRAIFAGGIYRVEPGPLSLSLASDVWDLLCEAFPNRHPRRAHVALGALGVLKELAKVRQALCMASYAGKARALMQSLGFTSSAYYLDSLRLRAILPGGHHVKEAAPAYTVHRDTWFANPQAQINLWLALHDASPRETFFFLPDCFARPVENNSAAFDHCAFSTQVGWQRVHPPDSAVYPTATEDLRGARRVGFACKRGELILFSAAHLHGTWGMEEWPLPSEPPLGADAGWARFSVDFRIVHPADLAAGHGAKNLDSSARGSALFEYSPPTLDAIEGLCYQSSHAPV